MKTCHECLYAEYRESEYKCENLEVRAHHKDLKDVPTFLERKQTEGVCGAKGRLWTMYTEGNQ